ncbi:MAG: substrate-binding domain-containing protein [Lachnospiraceae bacterium]|nr:substrate-binding domain-containing protein [Lachnospiraceae bacterium]
MKKKLLSSLLAVAMVASLVGCGSSASTTTTAETPAAAESAAAETPAAETEAATEAAAGESAVSGMTVAFIPKLTGNSFFEAANVGAQEYASKWGMTVEYMGSATASVTDQIEVIQQAIDAGVDAIAISSVDATALDEKLKEAQDAGIVVCTWDSDVSGDARALMVSQGTADVLGPMLVDMGVEALKNRGVDVDGEVKYVWHYSQASVADQNSWYVAGEEYIKANYPKWVAVADPYYSEQDSQKSVTIGEAVLDAHPDVDLIICNDSTALPGQCQAAQNKGLTKDDITITGFCTPSGMTAYLEADILERWGLWDCGVQGALGCYFAAYLAAGNEVKAGDTVTVPEIGDVSIVSNGDLVDGAATADTNNGVVLLPERVVFTAENVADYNF